MDIKFLQKCPKELCLENAFLSEVFIQYGVQNTRLKEPGKAACSPNMMCGC